MGLTPSDVVKINFETNDDGKELINKFASDMKKVVNVSEIVFESNDGGDIKVGELIFKVKISK